MDNPKEKSVPKQGIDDGPQTDHGDRTPEQADALTDRVPVRVSQDLAAEHHKIIEVIRSGNNPAVIFSNADGGGVVELNGPEIKPLTRDRVGVLMAQKCTFHTLLQSGRQKRCYHPDRLTGAVADALPRHLPVLNGVKTSPFFYKGELVGKESGYHDGSGYYCLPDADYHTHLKPNECIRRLDDLLGEFPFKSQADRANAYGMLVGQILKAEMVSPILFVDKPASQTGASKLAQCIAALADGRSIATLTQGRTADETDKRILTKLVKHPPSVLIDNLSTDFVSDIISSGLTSEFTGSRLLGGHQEAVVKTLSLQWHMTGVNAAVSKEVANRTVSVRLDAGMERPEERTDFRHKLPGDAFTQRAYYFSAALSLVQRWIDAGCPSGKARVMDSFGEWMLAVSGILENAGVEGFNENRDIFLERADVSGDEDAEFVNKWYDLHGEEHRAPSTLLNLADDILMLGGKDDAGRAKSLGHRLRKLVDRVFNVDGTPVAVRRLRNGSSTYFLKRLQDGPPRNGQPM